MGVSTADDCKSVTTGDDCKGAGGAGVTTADDCKGVTTGNDCKLRDKDWSWSEARRGKFANKASRYVSGVAKLPVTAMLEGSRGATDMKQNCGDTAKLPVAKVLGVDCGLSPPV